MPLLSLLGIFIPCAIAAPWSDLKASIPEPWSDLAASILGQPSLISQTESDPYVGFFLRNSSIASSGTVESSSGLAFTHFRLAPIFFPEGMQYHFDGLAGILRFTANGTHISWTQKPFHSHTYDDWDDCLYLGTGTTKVSSPSRHICFQNPGVNLLPIGSPPQLWLTIDTIAWGRVDPDTLETVQNAHVAVESSVLNAHPACDGTECFVQHPCDATPLADSVCISRLDPDKDGTLMHTTLFSSVDLGETRLIQHSHSPCITPNFVVAKIDSFQPRRPSPERSGILKVLHQKESAVLMVMDRRTNESSILELNGPDGSVHSNINNHFWNCYEDNTSLVFEEVPATESYLDSYYSTQLASTTVNWTSIFHPPLRCRIQLGGAQANTSQCQELGQGLFHDRPFDYPTYNPRFKMNPDYRYFYAIAPRTSKSRWFDSLIKVDVSGDDDLIAAEWAEPNIFLTEASFLPLGDENTQEDDGALLSVLYNATSDSSAFAIFNASTLKLLEIVPLGGVLPFHAHGVVCPGGGEQCYPNP